MLYHHRFYFFSWLCLAALLYGGIAIPEFSLLAQSPKEEQIFRYNAGSEPESLDPAVISGTSEIQLCTSLFEGLLCQDASTLKVMPAVATHWNISENGTCYTFFLRESRWSDGTSLTAQDFYRSWQRVLEPKTGAPYASQLFPILGAEAYNAGGEKDFKNVGLRVINPHCFEVTLHHPCPYFLDLCAFVALFPVPLKVVEKYGDRWVRPENFVSNGPFSLQAWLPRKELILVPNLHYYDKNSIKLSRIEAKLIDDHDTAYKLFLQKELDWITHVPLPKIDEAKWNPAYYASPYIGNYFYRFNTTRKPFDDKRVRRALSMSVYRQALTRQVLKGGEQAAAFFCPALGSYQPIEGLSYNPQEANRLLDECGYKDRSTFPETEIFYNTSEAHKKIAETIADQWSNSLGISVRLRNSEWKVFLQTMAELNFEICRSSWIGDYEDPNTFFDLFKSNGGNNRTGWSNANYDELLNQSQRELDPQRRNHLFQRMERLLVEDECPIMPLYIYVNKGMISPRVAGWYENLRDIHPLKSIYIEKPR